MRESAAAFIRWWPIIFRAGLYFSIGGLPSLIKACHEFGTDGLKVSFWLILGCLLEGIYQGFVALRAYFDGSAGRLGDEIRKSNGHTDFLLRQRQQAEKNKNL